MNETADGLIEPLVEDRSAIPVSVTFDGIIEGTFDDSERIEQATAQLAQAHPPLFDVSFEGSRCSLLVDDRVHAGRAFTRDHWDRLDQRLQAVINLLDGRDDIDSTLRCTERLSDHLRETLFLIDGKRLRRVSRQRPLPEPDQAPADGAQHRLRPAVIIVLLFVLLGILLIWHDGLLWRLSPQSSSSLQIDEGSGSTLIATSICETWGRYHITLVRGAQYPATPDQLAHALAAAKTMADRAFINLVADGGEISVILEDHSGKPLATVLVSLRPLLSSASGQATCDLPGDQRAATLHLALDAPAISP